MKKYVKITFLWDDENDERLFTIIVPPNLTVDEVIDIIEDEHNYLCFEDDTDRYGNDGRNPETLLQHICEKYNWEYTPFICDIEIKLS